MLKSHPAWLLARPNIFTARAAHNIGRLLLGQLLFADWAGLSHYISHGLASCLTEAIFVGYHNVVRDARECDKATCRVISAAACVRRFPFALLKSKVVTLCSQKIHVKVVPAVIDLVV